MVDRLRAVIEQAEQLSPEAQERLATVWEEELEEARWQATLSRPESLDLLDRMAAEAIAEDEAGLTRDLEELCELQDD
ncbi:MAG TPA: hypothetical protein VF116_06885 [Ktedonobacterales bacterium]